ncbi:MAG: aldehyde dehydrogenase family protein [Bifidobacteriaceae bacterium]|jgi:aldehyde dehydrogenase (NAD+)|nr:aldehyde dehydrogenase family protein [Bifidobacteriaceae bacterium]
MAANKPAYSGFDKQFIAGEWREGTSPREAPDTDPYTGQTLTTIRLASKDDVDQAYAAAAEAQREWGEAPPARRAAVIAAAGQILAERQDEITDWLIRESGSARFKAAFEAGLVSGAAPLQAVMPYRAHGQIRPSDVPDTENRILRQPLGVIGVISPWNFPFVLSMRSVMPALALGNAVVLKPASDTPITGGLLVAKVLEEAGLPQGLLSVVVGAGSEIGDYLVEHEVPKLISFTGSSEVGQHVGALAVGGRRMKRVGLELGGNAPFVVLDDADVEQAAVAAVFGRFLHQGQICMSTNRIVVDASIYDQFADAFVEHTRALKYGDPADPEVLVGPIINKAQLETLVAKAAQCRAEGAVQVLGGEPVGQVLPPHVFTEVTQSMVLAREETFGPMAPIIRAANEEDALAIANDTEYGLSSAVFSGDLDRATRFAAKIEAGMTHVNDQTVGDEAHVMFGGEKNSGLGRFNDEWIIEEFTRTHWLAVKHGPVGYPV